MDNPKREVFYDMTTGKFFIADDIQTKLNELLDVNRVITLHEMYSILAESMSEEQREKFLEAVSHPWSDKPGDISFEHFEDWPNIIFVLKRKEDSP